MRGAKGPPSTPTESTQAANSGRGEQPSSSGSDEASRVIYIGQLPHGFFEEQLKGTGFSGYLGDLAPCRAEVPPVLRPRKPWTCRVFRPIRACDSFESF